MSIENAYLTVQAMHAGSSSGAWSSGYCFLYGKSYDSESNCTGAADSMIWYGDVSK